MRMTLFDLHICSVLSSSRRVSGSGVTAAVLNLTPGVKENQTIMLVPSLVYRLMLTVNHNILFTLMSD